MLCEKGEEKEVVEEEEEEENDEVGAGESGKIKNRYQEPN